MTATAVAVRPDAAGGAAGAPAGHLPGLTGLRAVAVVAVIAFHLQEGRSSWFEGGWAGVDIFFVLSGYLVTELVLADGRPPAQAYLRFLQRRAARLVPAAAVLLAAAAAALLVSPALVDRTNIDTVPVHAHAGALFLRTALLSAAGVANLEAAHGVRLTPALGHLWSLDVEWQFYVAWPLVVLAVRPALLRRLTVGLVALAACYPMLIVHGRSDWVTVYFSTIPHLASLGAGALVAQLPRPASPRPVAAVIRVIAWPAVLAVLLLLGDSDGKYRFGVVLVAAPAAALVYAYAQPGARATFLGHPILQWLGERSYGIYLWHLPLLGATADDGPVVRIGAVLLAVVLADASLRCVEQPVRRWVRGRQSRRARQS